MKKTFGILMAVIAVFALAVPAFAAPLLPGAEVKNENANPNACWGMDRSFYADGSDFKDAGDNMDIKRSFDPANGKIGEQRAAWVATHCDPHGPVAE